MKKIEHMEPFNEFFYRDCYYNSLFSILKHFEVDIWSVIANEVFLYCSTPENCLHGTASYLCAKSMDLVLREQNVKCSYVYQRENIIQHAIEAIDYDSPVIALVDCYEEEIRKDFFHKEHLDHSMLLYGYDEVEKEFIVMEQTKKNTLNYSEKRISFQSLENAINSYQELYGRHKADEPLLTCFSYAKNVKKQEIESIKESAKSIYARNYLKMLPEFAVQDMIRMQMKNKLSEYLSDGEYADGVMEEVLESLNAINNAYLVEKIKWNLFLENRELEQLLESILSNWQVVRLAILNTIFEGNNLEEKRKEAKKKLILLEEEEKKLNNLVFFYLTKNL
ncbi:cysteine peptidase family C39 domain-containing protein [[Clostridium] polysaccharolyticum]|uniref:Butirosin biosynthesis protein H, N-terminal n=1 Tax=[Clostridium] polysaccharolyticum TaxID=29364 RepID=A0A1I0C3S0_9FIRM|nr:hypothetical protein [[Clostridium] polysaccharolyticum]SET14071.1 hypothetical protein SAMN04487772_1098 [[Clostridium] polysaccharolyticum]